MRKEAPKRCLAVHQHMDLVKEIQRRFAKVIPSIEGVSNGPSVAQADFIAGRYELRFAVADYFRARGQGAEMPFLDVVTLAVGLMADQGHYHVPLLCSPWSYATYRGS
jgi:5-hydroxyisourate hydrolase-like protein (transthyretin family)